MTQRKRTTPRDGAGNSDAEQQVGAEAATRANERTARKKPRSPTALRVRSSGKPRRIDFMSELDRKRNERAYAKNLRALNMPTPPGLIDALEVAKLLKREVDIEAISPDALAFELLSAAYRGNNYEAYRRATGSTLSEEQLDLRSALLTALIADAASGRDADDVDACARSFLGLSDEKERALRALDLIDAAVGRVRASPDLPSEGAQLRFLLGACDPKFRRMLADDLDREVRAVGSSKRTGATQGRSRREARSALVNVMVATGAFGTSSKADAEKRIKQFLRRPPRKLRLLRAARKRSL